MNLNYKSDYLFNKYLKMSSYCESLAVSRLNQLGHNMVSNDLGSCSSVIYKDPSLKKKRNADLICKKCGLRVEVRAKSSLMISMSDSESRPFHKELGLESLVCFSQVSETDGVFGLDSDLFFTSVKNLMDSIDHSKMSNRKSNAKGSETFRVWPCIKAPFDCRIKKIDFYSRKLIIEKTNSSEIVSILVPENFFFIDKSVSNLDFIRKNSILASSVRQTPTALLYCNQIIDNNR